MARYITQEMNDLDGKGEKRVYYRMKIEENIDANQFMDEIAYPGSGLSRATSRRGWGAGTCAAGCFVCLRFMLPPLISSKFGPIPL